MTKFWEENVALSSYHFDNTRFDPRFDAAQALGTFEGDWADEVKQLIDSSAPLTFESRGTAITEENTVVGNVYDPPFTNNYKAPKQKNHSLEKEFFDTTDLDYENYEIINKSTKFGPTINKIIDSFKFATPTVSTAHIQRTGQVFPYHIDVFHRVARYKDVPQDKILRVVVMLTDWVPGHIFGYGNGVYTHWKAGDFHTFDHASTPHWTANATYPPRVSLLLTGVKTEATEEFLYRARTSKTIKI